MERKFIYQLPEQARFIQTNLCDLMSNQTFVDLTFTCNSYVIKAHKCVVASGSTYFKEHFLKDPSIDRVIINGIKPAVLKSLIEYIYTGKSFISEGLNEELMNAASFLGIGGFPDLNITYDENKPVDQGLATNPPIFFSKHEKPRYYFKDKPVGDKNKNCTNLNNTKRGKMSFTRIEEYTNMALAREEVASRLAIERLQETVKNGANVFIIDDSCTEATIQTDLSVPLEESEGYMIENGTLVSIPQSAQDKITTIQGSGNLVQPYNGVPIEIKTTSSSNQFRPVQMSRKNVSYIMDQSGTNQCIKLNNHFQPLDMHIIPKTGGGLVPLPMSFTAQRTVTNFRSNDFEKQKYFQSVFVDDGQGSNTEVVNITSADTSNTEMSFQVISSADADGPKPFATASAIDLEKTDVDVERTTDVLDNDGSMQVVPAAVTESYNYVSATSDNRNDLYTIPGMIRIPIKRKRGRPSKKMTQLGWITGIPVPLRTPNPNDITLETNLQNHSQQGEPTTFGSQHNNSMED